MNAMNKEETMPEKINGKVTITSDALETFHNQSEWEMIGEIEYYIHPGKITETNTIQVSYLMPDSIRSWKRIQYLRLDYYDREKPNNSNYTLTRVEAPLTQRLSLYLR